MSVAFFAREEFFGFLLFDRRRHKYVVPTDRTAMEATRAIVQEHRTPSVEELARAVGKSERVASMALAEAQKIGLTPENVCIQTRRPQPGRISAPLNVYLDYTSFCNLSCSFCYDFIKLNGRKRADELTVQEIVGILDQLREMGTFRIDIAGGEPTIWRDYLLAYLEEARQRDIAVSVTSNATLIDDALAEAIVGKDLKTFTVSIDGSDAETHDAVRGEGAFAKACRGFSCLVRAKRRAGSTMHIAIKYTFSPGLSAEAAASYVRLAIGLGADRVKFNPLRPSGKAEEWSDLVADPPAYYRALESIQKAIETYGREIDIAGPMNPATCFGGRIPYLQQWGCIAGKELIAIDSIGNVRPCSMMTDYVLGNIRQQPLRELYEDSPRNIRLREARDHSCDHCAAFGACGGGCRVRSIAAGDMFRKDPLCPVDAGVTVKLQPPATPAFEYLGLPHSL